jgi:ribose 5-phosphate isomerase A
MVVGLGAGSTARFAVERIAALIANRELSEILAVPCSRDVAALAARLGIPATSIDDHPAMDLTIDGADEVDANLDLIKGAGGALLREKIVAQVSRREIIVVDASKASARLGTRSALPVEVTPFGWRSQAHYIASLGGRANVRIAGGAPYRTESDNLILDCTFGPLGDPHALARRLEERAGIVTHGLFLGLATDLVVAGADGVRHVTR